MPNRMPAPRTCRYCGSGFRVLVGDARYLPHRVGTCPSCLADVRRAVRDRDAEPVVVPLPDLSAGLCFGVSDDTWFPFDGDAAATRRAAAVCADCPVRAECLRYAMESGERFGVWGGLGPRERYRLRRRWAG